MKRHKIFIILIIFCLSIASYSCNEVSSKPETLAQDILVREDSVTNDWIDEAWEIIEVPEYKQFSRKNIEKRLSEKIKNEVPLVVHLFVPLCDNDNQGIVAVGGNMGDGLNLRENLYWGAGYGVKTRFVRQKDWKLVYDSLYQNKDILERVIFYKKFGNGAMVYLVADAYRGDRMKECVRDYLHSLTGEKSDFVFIEDKKVKIHQSADLLAFNEYDGIMDFQPEYFVNKDSIEKDAVVIACTSYQHFEDYLGCAKGFPLITTNGLLAPEAYVIEAVVNSWALLKTPRQIEESAGQARVKTILWD